MSTPEPVEEPSLADYLAVLWRRLPVILLVTVAVVAAAGVVLFIQTKQYQATAAVEIQTGRLNPTTGQTTTVRAQDATQLIQTEIQVITGPQVRQLVVKQVGSSAPTATASQVPNTNIVHIAVQDPKPADAVKVANAYVAAYSDVRKQGQLNVLNNSIKQVQTELTSVQGLLTQVENQVASQPAANIPAAQARFGPEETDLEHRASTLGGQLDSLKIAVGTAASGVTPVGSPSVPSSPISPSKSKTLGIALVAGLILGLGIGLLLEYLDGTVKDARDLARTVPGVPVLAVVPGGGGRRRLLKRRAPTEEPLIPEGRAAQAYGTAALAIAAQQTDRPLDALVVTGPEESVARQATGLATGLASTGRNVVLVDASPRAATLPEELVEPDRGLAGAADGTSYITESGATPGLFVVGAGKDPSPYLPSEPVVKAALERLSQSMDVAVLSTEPILVHNDAAVLAPETSGAVLVARVRKTTRRSIKQAIERLGIVKAEVIGVILDEG